MATATPSRAPKLIMDDGSRVFLDDSAAVATSQAQQMIVKDDQVEDYFEVERISKLLDGHASVAVQFPATLICYMAKVLELLQNAHPDGLVFGLTGGCCPDLATAAHLNATALVQYGHACLSQAGHASIEIIHGFGQKDINIPACVDVVKAANVRRLLVFYSLEYAHAIEEMQTSLSEQADILVLVGDIPERRRSSAAARAVHRPCCSSSSENGASSSCCRAVDKAAQTEERHIGTVAEAPEPDVATIGGLTVDRQALETFQHSAYSVLYLGSNENLQFLTIAIRLASPSPPESLFAINLLGFVEPVTSNRASQLLKSRFYLIQKVKLCHVFGILVADVNRDATTIQETISSVQKLLRDENRVSYTFVVGTLSPAKLANFGEIDCFVWLACPEHSILQHNNTDYHVPVVTPYELLVAFDRVPWGTYETQASIESMLQTSSAGAEGHENGEQSDSDAPFFSLVTGTFQQQRRRFENSGAVLETDDPISLQQLPGEGVLSTYRSAAAEWLKSRDYKGLVVDKNAPVGPATPGRTGIASKYQAR